MIKSASRTPPHRHKSWDLWTGWPEPNLSTESKLWCFCVWKGLLGPRLTNSLSIRLYPAPCFDSGTSWLGVGTSWPKVRYELTKNGYELTKVRVDLGTSWLETRQFTDTHFEDCSPTELKAVRRQNWRQFTDTFYIVFITNVTFFTVLLRYY